MFRTCSAATPLFPHGSTRPKHRTPFPNDIASPRLRTRGGGEREGERGRRTDSDRAYVHSPSSLRQHCLALGLTGVQRPPRPRRSLPWPGIAVGHCRTSGAGVCLCHVPPDVAAEAANARPRHLGDGRLGGKEGGTERDWVA